MCRRVSPVRVSSLWLSDAASHQDRLHLHVRHLAGLQAGLGSRRMLGDFSCKLSCDGALNK